MARAKASKKCTLAVMPFALALILAACAGDDEIPDPPGSPAPDTIPDPPGSTDEPDEPTPVALAIDALDETRWWAWAESILGIPLVTAETRFAVATDVLAICTVLDTPPTSFESYLAELDRIVAPRTRLGNEPLEPRSYAVVLDAAISSVCPDEAATVEPLRPRPASVPLDDQLRGNTLIVPDPRPGDMRSDHGADVLPPGYEPPAAHETILDLTYGDDPAQKLDLYLPTHPGAPIVVYLHAGGWIGGDKQFVPDMVLRLVDRGYAVASVGYRLAPAHRFPAPVHDVKHAIRWLKAYGARVGLVDGDHIVVYGASAGGHLAAFVAATPGRFEPDDLTPEEATFDSSVHGVVSVVGPTDLVQLYANPNPWAAPIASEFLGCNPCAEPELRHASPISHLHPGLPPAYWAYGEDDGLVDAAGQGAAIATAWGDLGGIYSSWLDLVEGAGHNMDGSTINQRWVEAFIHFVTTPG